MAGTTDQVWLYVFLIVSSFLFGLAMLFLGLRGKRLDNHPVCRKCKYDLTGSSDATSCPECGTGLSNRHAIRIGNRRIRYLGIVFGLLLILLAGIAAGVQLRGVNINHYKPMWWLRMEARNTSRPSAEDSLEEIMRRMGRNWDNRPQDAQSLLEDALEVQADTTRPWREEWGEIAYNAILSGAGTETQHRQFIRAYSSLKVYVRRKARIGQPIPLVIEMHRDTRNPGDFNDFSIHHDQYRIFLARGDEQREFIATVPIAKTEVATRMSDQIWMDLPPLHDADPGKYKIMVTGTITIPNLYEFTFPDSPLCAWDAEATNTIELLPADGPPAVELIDDPSMASLFAKAQASVIIRPRDDHKRGNFLAIHIKPPYSCDYGLAFDVFVSDGERTWPTDYPVTDYPKYFKGHVLSTVAVLPDNFKADQVDIVLQPNLGAAETTIDVIDVLNHTIIIKDVPVDRQPQAR